MSINNFRITLCASSLSHDVEELAIRVSMSPSKTAPAIPSRDDHRVFWEFEKYHGEQFDEALARASGWACLHAKALLYIQDINLSLWCELHSNSEFAGFSLQGAHMEQLGQSEIELVISVYAERCKENQ